MDNDMLSKIEMSAKYVGSISKNVVINYNKLDKMISCLNASNIRHWLDSNPFNIFDMNYEEIINFLLIYHTIGDFCFWGDPKWTIKTEYGNLDGSFAMMYIVIKRIKETKNFDLTFEEFSKLLKANVEIPLLNQRYDCLLAMNEFLKGKNKDFYSLIKDINNDKNLFEYIIENLKYFNDECFYDDKKVYFYKRAQLLTSDILHIREKKEHIKVDYTHLLGCADYKIPQVMRCYGILEFSEKLSQLVDNKVELLENSPMEIEIRANTLIVIDYIYQKTNRKISRININDYIWLLGQDKIKITKPYHRTLTIHY